MCGVLGSVDQGLHLFLVGDHKPGNRVPGAHKQRAGQWLSQEGQHAWNSLLFTADGGLMSHKGCSGFFELTLLYIRCQMGWICHRGAMHQLDLQKPKAIPCRKVF